MNTLRPSVEAGTKSPWWSQSWASVFAGAGAGAVASGVFLGCVSVWKTDDGAVLLVLLVSGEKISHATDSWANNACGVGVVSVWSWVVAPWEGFSEETIMIWVWVVVHWMIHVHMFMD